ncbi:MAG: MOSC domain-containing protein [Burkholderiaceae bacterium]
MDTLRTLTSHHPSPGRIDAIYLRSVRGEPVHSVDEASALKGKGLAGDRASLRTRARAPGASSRARDLTLVQAEALALLEAWSGQAKIDGGELRRNLLVSGLNLNAMRSPFPDGIRRWAIGSEVIIEITGPCEPCSKMEQALGHGGYNMMRGFGGLTAAICTDGLIRVGDLIRPVESPLS